MSLVEVVAEEPDPTALGVKLWLGVVTVPLTWRPTDWVCVVSAGAAKSVLLLDVKSPPHMTVVGYGEPDVSGVPSGFTA